MLDKSERTASVKKDANLSEEEVARFDTLAKEWWNPEGKFKTALAFNAARVELIIKQMEKHFSAPASFDGLSVLDVGCGGGLICEPLARKGATVTGIDPSGVSVQVARRHAQSNGLDIDYRHQLVQDIQGEDVQFDVVINAEVVEHVPDQQALIAACASLVRPGGMLVLATLNRTIKSYFVAIVGAEYIMRYLPVGTHSWNKFVKPSELSSWVGSSFVTSYQTGLKFNPFTRQWRAKPGMSVNYLKCFKHSSK